MFGIVLQLKNHFTLITAFLFSGYKPPKVILMLSLSITNQSELSMVYKEPVIHASVEKWIASTTVASYLQAEPAGVSY